MIQPYHPFEIEPGHPTQEQPVSIMYSPEGKLWIKVNNLDISIKQTNDGKGITIDVTDSSLAMMDLGTISVSYESAEI